MANRHKHHEKHKKGGGAMSGRDDYAGSGEPDVVKEAHEKKHGGAVHGHKGKHRVHKARGGGVGSDKHPFSSAHSGSKAG